MDEKKPRLYLCAPEKNRDCRKTGCYYTGKGRCYLTKNPAFAVLDENGAAQEVEIRREEGFEVFLHGQRIDQDFS